MLLASLALVAVAACDNVSETPAAAPEATALGLMPTQSELQAALRKVVFEADGSINPGKNGGFGLNMWATVVDCDGIVRNVVFSGPNRNAQWPGSRVISAQKANTANAFSLRGLALSTANIFTATQPGGSLSGLQFSNPVNTDTAYGGSSATYGPPHDYMVGRKIGGVNVFGGGLPLYTKDGQLIGALGVSGDSSCADHNIAWKLRDALQLDYVPAGVARKGTDNIIYDAPADGAAGFEHPRCSPEATAIGKALPDSHEIGALAPAMTSASATNTKAEVAENFSWGLQYLKGLH